MNAKISIRKVLIPIGIILSMAIAVAAITARSPFKSGPSQALTGPIKVGSVIPDFDLFPYQKSETRLSKLGARVTLINFWASWCDACLIEMPGIVKLQSDFKSLGFEVVAINVDEEPDTVLPRLIKKFAFNFPAYIDKEQKLSELFDISALPYSLIIDQNNTVLFMEVGEVDWNSKEIRSQLGQWLSRSNK
jgi:thiol-disulfide isomerase/thioredoxin